MNNKFFKKVLCAFSVMTVMCGCLMGCATKSTESSDSSGKSASSADSSGSVTAVSSDSSGSDADASSSSNGELKLYGFAAGAADSFLLYTDNSAVLIDCGEKGFGKDILEFLEDKGIKAIDYLIITHFDKDHVGGAAKVINNITVKNILQSNYTKDSKEYSKYSNACSEAGVSPQTLRKDFDFELDGVKYLVNAPIEETYSVDPSNNSSLITTVEYGDTKMLFMGDAQDARLEEFLKSEQSPCDFLKVPHHGRYEQGLESLIKKVQPKYAVITSSDDEPEDQSTLSLFSENDIETFLTRAHAIQGSSDGKKFVAGYDN